jgi:hypothetical protein
MGNRIALAILLCVNLQLSIAQEKGSVPSSSTQVAERGTQTKEYEIAGLRPGKDAVGKAYHRFGKESMRKQLSASDSAVWVDDCNYQMLTVTFDRDNLVRDVTIQHSPGVTNADCDLRSYSRAVRSRMGGTRHGLLFRDRCSRVQEIYGAPPQLQGEATGKKDLMYRYDFKGRSFTFEVTCDSASNVDMIKLTSSSSSKP